MNLTLEQQKEFAKFPAPLRALVERYGGRCYVAAADQRRFTCTICFALF